MKRNPISSSCHDMNKGFERVLMGRRDSENRSASGRCERFYRLKRMVSLYVWRRGVGGPDELPPSSAGDARKMRGRSHTLPYWLQPPGGAIHPIPSSHSLSKMASDFSSQFLRDVSNGCSGFVWKSGLHYISGRFRTT